MPIWWVFTKYWTHDSKMINFPYLSEYMEEEMKCKLPWTSDENKEDMQVCSSNDHLMNFSTLSRSMMYFGESKYYQVTKCLQPCQYYYFKAKQVSFRV